MIADRTRFARRLFAGIAPQYERMGALLSFGQDARWRRFLVSRTNAVPGARVLDVAAGTQLVSRALAAGRNVRVVALDQSEPMLRAGREPNRLAGLDDRIRPVLGQAERLPFGDDAFDAVSFTYLLRYVDDPGGTVRELARVLRAGRVDRDARVLRPGRRAGSGGLVDPDPGRDAPDRDRRLTGVGAHGRLPRTQHLAFRRSSSAGGVGPMVPGGGDPARPDEVVPVRLRGRALGCEGTVSDGRPAFYALAPGGWRDWWTLLHPPYTLWHLSYVALGAATAAELDLYRLGLTLLGFFLGVGLAAHALDELRGRPLGTSIPDGVLIGLAIASLCGAAAIGVIGIVQVSGWLAVFIAVGAFLVVAYNLELFGGAFHSDLWFALAWGGFPALDGRVRAGRDAERCGRRRRGGLRGDQRSPARALHSRAPAPAPRRRRRGHDHAAGRHHGAARSRGDPEGAGGGAAVAVHRHAVAGPRVRGCQAGSVVSAP